MQLPFPHHENASLHPISLVPPPSDVEHRGVEWGVDMITPSIQLTDAGPCYFCPSPVGHGVHVGELPVAGAAGGGDGASPAPPRGPGAP